MTTLSVLPGVVPRGSTTLERPRYSLIVANDREHRIAAQRLRFDVFAGEPGFAIPANEAGLDADRFDDHCDHLLVRDERTEQFVGCYRMLPPSSVAAAGGYYTATEFDLTELDPVGNRIVEMGRACVRPDHRNGSVVTLMWAGILHYIQLTGYDAVMGCVSVPMNDVPDETAGANARGVRDELFRRHLSPVGQRVRPYVPVPNLDELVAPAKTRMPALMRGYLRLGASICGEPAHDPDFGVADFVALLRMPDVNVRYLERLQQAAASLEG